MQANLPILYQNIMAGLPSDFARDVFLWAVERPGEGAMCYRAERFAHEADRLVKSLLPMIDLAGPTIAPDIKSDLMGFILKRHANWRYGGNVSPPYCADPLSPPALTA